MTGLSSVYRRSHPVLPVATVADNYCCCSWVAEEDKGRRGDRGGVGWGVGVGGGGGVIKGSQRLALSRQCPRESVTAESGRHRV